MLARWAETTKNPEADQTVKACLLRADSRVDPDRLAKLVQVAVSGDENQPLIEWFLLAKGLHAYRTGRFADALMACRESRRRTGQVRDACQAITAVDLAIEAMALRGHGDAAAAQRSLAEARQLIDQKFPVLDADGWWYDLLAAHVLYREAEALVDGHKDEAKQ